MFASCGNSDPLSYLNSDVGCGNKTLFSLILSVFECGQVMGGEYVE